MISISAKTQTGPERPRTEIKALWRDPAPDLREYPEASRDSAHSSSTSLDDLVRAAQCAQAGALQQLYTRFQPIVKRLLSRYRHLPVVEDLPGEIYLEFVRLTKLYDAERGIPFPSYLKRMLGAHIHTVVRRDCRFRFREVSLSTSDRYQSLEGGEEGPAKNGELKRFCTRGDEVIDSVLTKDLLRRVELILTPRQAEVFIRHALHEEDYSRIASVLDSTPAAARFLYHCARRTLQKRLQYVREQ